MTTSPRLGITDLAEAQAAADVTHNAAVHTLEQGAGKFTVKDRDLAAPPGSPAAGDAYLVAAAASGAWSGKSGYIAFWLNGAWAFIAMREGYALWVEDENKFLVATSASTFIELATGGNPTESIIVAVSDESTALVVGGSKVTFRMPYAFTLAAIRASLVTAQISGSIFTVDVNEAGASLLSTKLTIDNGEKTTTTAAAAAVISDAALADDAEITVDIDQVGDGTAKGLKVTLIGSRV